MPARHPQIRQGEQRDQLRGVFRQPTEAHPDLPLSLVERPVRHEEYRKRERRHTHELEEPPPRISRVREGARLPQT